MTFWCISLRNVTWARRGGSDEHLDTFKKGCVGSADSV